MHQYDLEDYLLEKLPCAFSPEALGSGPAAARHMRVNISDRSCTTLGAVGRKTRRTQDSVYSFRLIRAGFEPFRACGNPTRLYGCANR